MVEKIAFFTSLGRCGIPTMTGVVDIWTSLERVGDDRFIYITTTGRKSGRQHTVELWFALAGERVYLSHEGEYTDWMKNILRRPDVTARVSRVKFDGTARIVELGSPSRKLGETALYEKYYGRASMDVIDDWFELSAIIELKLSKPPG